MSLEKLINNDIKAAMLAKDAKKLEALRAVKSSLLLLKTGKDVSGGEIPESLEISTLQKLVKQRKESAAIYQEKGRQEMAEDELFQAGIIEKYLPEQMSEEDVEKAVLKAIEATGASTMKDMGKVMGMVSKELAGKADNKMIANFVKKNLQA
ncbi:MAG: glutamyl-tRNA amidotransferase [Bacteroidetes bacterium]|nr:glutamyl-tRNA amidotransferase [Bacteroidota bacterium]|tara:strand:+ start:81 stop:536 length:456 start_codon:yes stop_codon:yes gene_type:complete